jgi:hypothetical protein
MATRPNVTVQVVDNSFITAAAEAASSHISGMYSANGLLTVFGTTGEKNNKIMTIQNATDWIGRLEGTTFGGTGAGPTGAWMTEWYSAYNYLLYGGVLSITDTATKFYDPLVALDSIFNAELTTTQGNFVNNTVAQRDDIVGVLGVTYAGYDSGTVPSSLLTIYPIDGTASEQLFLVGGEKVTLKLSNNNTENFATIPLSSDTAGCFARTDYLAQRWYSPAGTRRGRILNVIRLVKNPNATEQDLLYNVGVNSVIGIAGQGAFLFGDITNIADQTSTLSRINVVRLINYIKRTMTLTANSVLFELNDDTTRSLFKNAANGFLQLIKDGRGLYDFKVVCDASNNPGSVVDANQFVADLFIKPVKSINYVKIRITNLNTDAPLA